ncbi:secernin-3 [Syngnathus typhle]|uniref:secernin-3 n=1 Tax=Syngnathus typhle TaxID=161592 RepID=UPI002A6AC162|nr:secernin-3 [Syngnathus typhle]XP_061142625.1 secernin-3 [Syngnathus typhle]
MYPCSSDTFVALPPSTEGQRIIFGKNSDRPFDEVQEVLYFPAEDYEPGSKVECTYMKIEQVAHTYAIVLSRPAWLWGAEMGANEHQVCIGNEAVWGRESADGEKALLGMDLVRLALERADTAEKSVDVIAELLEKYGQGGCCIEEQCDFTYHNSFLISDRKEAWLLETSGRYWAAERAEGGYHNISNEYNITTKIDREHPDLRKYAQSKGWWDGEALFNFAAIYSNMNAARIEALGSQSCEGKNLLRKSNGHITAQTMMDILRDKDSGINTKGVFMTTASMVSVVPVDPTLPGVHYFTATPDPERSVFKPFVFVENMRVELKETTSPSYGPEDPVEKEPLFQCKPDRKHSLFTKHEVAVAIIETHKERGERITFAMRKLEGERMKQMEEILYRGVQQPETLLDLFPSVVRDEMELYGKISKVQ